MSSLSSQDSGKPQVMVIIPSTIEPIYRHYDEIPESDRLTPIPLVMTLDQIHGQRGLIQGSVDLQQTMESNVRAVVAQFSTTPLSDDDLRSLSLVSRLETSDRIYTVMSLPLPFTTFHQLLKDSVRSSDYLKTFTGLSGFHCLNYPHKPSFNAFMAGSFDSVSQAALSDALSQLGWDEQFQLNVYAGAAPSPAAFKPLPLESSETPAKQSAFAALTSIAEVNGQEVPVLMTIDRWDGVRGFIGGFVSERESLKDAVLREVLEEIGASLSEEQASSMEVVSTHQMKSLTTHLLSVPVPFDVFQSILKGSFNGEHHLAEVAGISAHFLTPDSLRSLMKSSFAPTCKEELVDLIRHLKWDEQYGLPTDFVNPELTQQGLLASLEGAIPSSRGLKI